MVGGTFFLAFQLGTNVAVNWNSVVTDIVSGVVAATLATVLTIIVYRYIYHRRKM